MTDNRTGKSSRASRLKTAALLVLFTAVGYVAATVAAHLPRIHVASSEYSLESRLANTENVAGSTESRRVSGAAEAASQAAAGDQADYFPDHYVNQATRVEEQPDTF